MYTRSEERAGTHSSERRHSERREPSCCNPAFIPSGIPPASRTPALDQTQRCVQGQGGKSDLVRTRGAGNPGADGHEDTHIVDKYFAGIKPRRPPGEGSWRRRQARRGVRGEEAEPGAGAGRKPRAGGTAAAVRGGLRFTPAAGVAPRHLARGRELEPADLPSGSLTANAASASCLRRNCKAVSPAPAAPTTAPATKPRRKRREPLKRDAKLLAAILPRAPTFDRSACAHRVGLPPESQSQPQDQDTHALPESLGRQGAERERALLPLRASRAP